MYWRLFLYSHPRPSPVSYFPPCPCMRKLKKLQKSKYDSGETFQLWGHFLSSAEWILKLTILLSHFYFKNLRIPVWTLVCGAGERDSTWFPGTTGSRGLGRTERRWLWSWCRKKTSGSHTNSSFSTIERVVDLHSYMQMCIHSVSHSTHSCWAPKTCARDCVARRGSNHEQDKDMVPPAVSNLISCFSDSLGLSKT